MLRRRLEFLEQPASLFYDNDRPLPAEEIADPVDVRAVRFDHPA